MPDSRITYTPHLGLSKLPANFHVWAQIMNDNLTTLDAAVTGFILIQNLRGPWTNSTAYAAGDSVVDTTTALIWRCQVTNISSTIPMTFAQERVAFPLYWVQYSTVGAGKGTWTGPGTSYVFNDFVVDHGRYAVCIIPHTSSSSFDIDLAAGKWNILIDVSLYLPLAGGTLTGPLIGTAATFNNVIQTATGDFANLKIAGATKGLRFVPSATGYAIEATDQTWTGTFQPLTLNGSAVTITPPATFSGLVTANARLNVTPTLGIGVPARTSIPLDAMNLADTAGFSNVAFLRQANNPGGTNYTQLIVEQNATNVMNFEVTDQANVKGTLSFQPFGGTVSIPVLTGTSATMSGQYTTSYGGPANPAIVFNAAAGNHRYIQWQSGASARWQMGVDNIAEGGANAGSNLFLNTFTDAGAYLGTPLAINRATNAVTFSGTVTAASIISGPGAQIQMVSTETGAVATGSTIIPADSTIPQITEGDQYMTLAITPKSATSKLIIEVTCILYNTAVNGMAVALFQDATANALAAVSQSLNPAGNVATLSFRHIMTSGTTSATTFRVRAGASSAGTTTFNGINGVQLYGGVAASSIVITETA